MKRFMVGLIGLTIVCAGIVHFAPKIVVRGDTTDAGVAINETNFPDDNFRQFVLDTLDSDHNEELSQAEISGVTTINVSNKQIDTLKGIAYFTELTELVADYNNVISLDLYANTKLKTLSVQSNELALLNVTKCTELETMKVGKNELTSLDLRYCEKLTTLDCRDNSLTDLNVSYNVNLVDLACPDNKIENLDVNNLTHLKNLNCKSNMLKMLYIDGCPELETLNCSKNAITTMDLSACTSLTTLNCLENVMTSLYLNGCEMLQSVNCKSNKLTTLDITGCYALQDVFCTGNYLTSLDVSGLTKLQSVQCIDNELTFLDVSDCPNLEEIVASQNKIDTFDCSNCPNLATLSIDCNQLTSLDLSGKTHLFECRCGSNKLTSIDVSGCTNLQYLYANANALSSLDLSDATKLLYLGVNGNELTSLDLSKNMKLEWIDCSSNCLTSLDLSDHTALKVLSCARNDLAELNVDNCEALYSLTAYINNLAGIDVSSCPKLRELIEKTTRKSGMHFDGSTFTYYKDESFQRDWYLTCDDDTVLFTVKPMKVTFDANGGSGFMPNALVVKDGSYVLPECAFAAPAGMGFAGWDLGNPGETIVVSSDIIVKATWKAINFTITVTTDGNGTASASATSAAMGTEITLTATPNDGYQFKQWQVVSGGVTITDNKFVVGSENVEIKAIFEQIPAKDPSFEDFVERLYVVALGRASEPEGKAFWVDQVVNKGFTGADCARFFMLGAPEFLGRNLTDDEFVEVLYKTYFDRDSEPDGKAYWMGRLASGTERAVLVEEFIESVEWCNVCAMYGVKSGAKYHKATVPSKNAVKFATRLYTCCLGRDPEAEGLEYWSLALTNLDATGYQAASLFFTLPEFVGLKTTNEEYLRRLYTTFMGRDPEPEGFAYWLELLNGGTDRNDVMKAFAGCPEFQEICNSYGIERGEI